MQIINLASSSNGNSYIIQTRSGTTLLLEAGLPFPKLRKAIAEHGIYLTDIDACIATHEHSDHAESLKSISRFIPVFTTKEAISQRNIIGAKALSSWEKITIKKTIITPFSVLHDVPAFGFVIEDSQERLFFANDTSMIKWNFKDYKFDYILIECNYCDEILEVNESIDPKVKERIKNSHMALSTTFKFLKNYINKNDAEVYLIHLSNNNSSERIMFKKISEIIDPKKLFICQQNGGIKGEEYYL